jgi:hypothetical protein
MPAEAVAANALAALQGVVKHIPKKWANVQVRGELGELGAGWALLRPSRPSRWDVVRTEIV